MKLTKKWKDIVVNKDLEDIAQLQRQIQKEQERIERQKHFAQFKDHDIDLRRK